VTVPPSVYVGYYVTLAVFVVTWVSIGYWVYADARARGSRTPFLWGLTSAFLLLPLAYYLFVYRRGTERATPKTRRERVAGVLAVSGVLAPLVTIHVTPPDAFTQVRLTPVVFAAGVFVTYLVS
jgi:hypothetical protein